MKEDIKIKLNPYLGKSKNFIELFSIIGYEKKIISNYISQQSEDVLILSKISEIKSDNCEKKIGTEDLIQKIYPNKPSILKITKTKKRLILPTSYLLFVSIILMEKVKQLFLVTYFVFMNIILMIFLNWNIIYLKHFLFFQNIHCLQHFMKYVHFY